VVIKDTFYTQLAMENCRFNQKRELKELKLVPQPRIP